MKLHIQHTTHYRYTEPLLYSLQQLHLWPQSGVWQSLLAWDIKGPGPIHELPDGQGNRQHSFSLQARPEQGIRELCVRAAGIVQTHGVAVFVETGPLPLPAFYRRSTLLAEPHPRMAAWAEQRCPQAARAALAGEDWSVDAALELTSAVADQVRYRSGSTGVETTALEAFDWGLGVCQDQAHVMLAVCRSLGVPVRYVSGYFFADNEPELASHAWVDVCLSEAERRWISLDVTHQCPTDERHVRLATGTDYSACPPTRGLRRGGGQESMAVDIRIQAA